ncbi:MAG TPA: hypothetical protein VII30_04075 [Gemmatimonadaceae bacterium]
MNERKLPGLPFDFQGGSCQGSTHGRSRPLLGLQRCDLDSGPDGAEYSAIGKPPHAGLAERIFAGAPTLRSVRLEWLGCGDLRVGVGFHFPGP